VEGEFAAEVTEIGPASIIIKSNVRFQLNDKPNIRSEFLSKLSLSHHNLEVTFPSKTLNISKFKTRLSILGLDPEEVSKLYRYINDS
jgi:hypothetical protein